jgi:hypothetical protein
MAELVLYTRSGCCLCVGLEERLRALVPPPPLRLIDVDADPALHARYDLLVPVLALVEAGGVGGAEGGSRELPRVPPRLAGERLRDWLQRQGVPGQGVD